MAESQKKDPLSTGQGPYQKVYIKKGVLLLIITRLYDENVTEIFHLCNKNIEQSEKCPWIAVSYDRTMCAQTMYAQTMYAQTMCA